MTITEKVQAVLIAAAGVTGLVPAARIKVPGTWQNLTRPYIVHRPVAEGSPTHTHDGGLESLRLWEFYQVSIFAATYDSGNAVAQAVRTALDGLHSGGVHVFYRGGPWYVGRDDETDTEHFALDFRIFEAL